MSRVDECCGRSQSFNWNSSVLNVSRNYTVTTEKQWTELAQPHVLLHFYVSRVSLLRCEKFQTS